MRCSISPTEYGAGVAACEARCPVDQMDGCLTQKAQDINHVFEIARC
jgi:hypothetical protein